MKEKEKEKEEEYFLNQKRVKDGMKKQKLKLKADSNAQTQDSLAVKTIQLGVGEYAMQAVAAPTEEPEMEEEPVKPTVVEVQVKGPKYPDLNKISALAQNKGNDREY